MNYYKRHIGDYAKKCGHLSVLEHGVYTLLLDAYYDRELAPTKAEALRQARARTPEEVAAVEAVLADFFHEVDGRYVQTRVEEEFVKAEAVAERNARRGKLGGRPRKPKGNPEESRRVSAAKPDESREKPNPLIHQSTKKEQKQKQPPQASASAFVLPAWIDATAWLAYLDMRKRKRAPPTDRACELVVAELEKLRRLGHDPTDVLDQSVRNAWTDVYPVKSPGASHGTHRESAADRVARVNAEAERGSGLVVGEQ